MREGSQKVKPLRMERKPGWGKGMWTAGEPEARGLHLNSVPFPVFVPHFPPHYKIRCMTIPRPKLDSRITCFKMYKMGLGRRLSAVYRLKDPSSILRTHVKNYIPRHRLVISTLRRQTCEPRLSLDHHPSLLCELQVPMRDPVSNL